ncbi:transcription elongation factor TFIIS [Thecaphora frezii]
MSGGGLSLEELKDLQKQLSKLSSSTDADAILSILKKLKAGLQPTEDIIRQSKIGVAVGKLRSHSDKKVADQAKGLVKDWKSIVDKQRKSKEAAASKSPSAAPSPSTPVPASPAKPSADASAKPSPAPPAKIDFETLGDKVRNACLKLLYQSLEAGKDVNGWEPSALFQVAVSIERAILENQGKGAVTTEYRNKVRSLSLNLKDKNNPQLRIRVVDGEILPEKLVTMTNEDLASDKRRQEIEELQMQNLFKAKGAAAQEAETDAFQCGRCKQRKTRYYQMQTRSADEPMTTFVTCVNCNHKWKFC